MKSSLIAALALVLLGSYSFVYACRESKPARTAQAPASPTAVASFTAVPAPTPLTETVVVCKTVASVTPITIEVDVPVETLGLRAFHIRGIATEKSAECDGPVETVKRTARVAATLGRAFVTTIGAVFGSLVDAAQSARASLV